MLPLVILASLLGTSLSLANPVDPVKRWDVADSQAECWTFYDDITATAENIDLESVIGGIPADQQALVQSQIDSAKAGSTVMSQIAAAPKQTQSGTYNMWFQYCQPKDTSNGVKGVFQTIHGIAGNAGYWNVILDGKTDNSFAESAAAAGWATLSYDRLGVGRSAHPNGIQTVQISYEIAQAVSIAQNLRSGGFQGIQPFDTIVGIGHSYGSALLTGLASVSPTAFDQIVLTGFSNNATSGVLGVGGFESTIASVAYPDRFSYGNDYIITPSVSIDQKEFFHYPNYTQSSLDLFTTTKGEYTLGQVNSINSVFTLDRSNFSRPVFVITGMNDAPFCAGDCSITSLGEGKTQVDTSRDLFPSVADTDFGVYIVPDTGHGINFAETAYDAYQQIIAFVAGHSAPDIL